MNTAQKNQYDFGNKTVIISKQYKPPPTGHRQSQSRSGKAGTSQGQGRLVTSNVASGFKNTLNKKAEYISQVKFEKTELGPQQKFKQMQKEINQLIEQSALACNKGKSLQLENFSEALQKAKQAANKQKNLRKQKQSQNMIDSINIDLSYCVQFNLAICLEKNGMILQAKNKYDEIKKSKQFSQAGRLKINIGNIYFRQKKYPAAIKLYQMGLDLVPASSKQMRFKIHKNIALAQVKQGNYQDAINTYQNIMRGSPDIKTAFNLLLCLYYIGDKLRMKDVFLSMLVGQVGYQQIQENQNQINEVIVDRLKQQMKEKRRDQIKLVILAAKLIAPIIQNDIISSYDWIIDKLKATEFPQAQSQIEITKAMAYVKKRQVEKAIENLKSLEKKDKITMGRVATNISFLFFLEKDYKNAQKYADIAINYDRYNSKALVNKGNCLYVKNQFLRSKQQYLQAIGVQADCCQALYNLGYVNKKMNLHAESLQALQKLQTIVALPQAIFQIANIHQMVGNTKQALKWYQLLLNKVPNDAGALSRVGNIFYREQDQQQALNHYMQSYRLLPSNMQTNQWLGIYYVKQQLYEKACHFLDRASQLQPKEVKWRLMVASCQRRVGNYQKALKIYKSIYQQQPNNLECLKFLVLLCKEMGLHYDQYAQVLGNLQRQNLANQDFSNMEMQMQNNNNMEGSTDEKRKKIMKVDQARRPIKKVAPKEEDWQIDENMLQA